MIDTDACLALLEPDSPVSRAIPAYELRNGQREMTSAVAQAMNSCRFALIEAGTGIGKSFAYLIPVILWAREHPDAHVVVSTATINLQDQLYTKDIPFLIEHVDPFASCALLMGRNNYLCLNRLAEETAGNPLLIEEESSEIGRIHRWAKITRTGMRTELAENPSAGVWASVCSDADFCLGQKCFFRRECFIMNARRKAQESQIIVVNHHVLFSDIAGKYEADSYDEAAILPPFTMLICDEAHKLEAAALSYFSNQTSRSGILRTLGALSSGGRRREQGILPVLRPHSSDPAAFDGFSALSKKLAQALQGVEDAASLLAGSQRTLWIPWDLGAPSAGLTDACKEAAEILDAMDRCLRRIWESVEEQDAMRYPLKLLSGYMRKLSGHRAVCMEFQRISQRTDQVFSLERRQVHREDGVILHMTPLSIAPTMQDALYAHVDTFVATSATLTVGGAFSYWKRQLGLDSIGAEVIERLIPSPFDFKRQVMVAVPSDAPGVENPGPYTAYLKEAVFDLVSLVEGRTLVLCTSFQMIRELYEMLSGPFERIGIKTLVQLPGSDRGRLLREFKQNGPSVLFAAESFWEGVDIPGDALSQIIITRLPFQVPTEPLVLARKRKIQEEGGNHFLQLALPYAAMRLKQGFGRLMRREQDFVVVCILDNRILTKHYGKVLLRSLPETHTYTGSAQHLAEAVERFVYAQR